MEVARILGTSLRGSFVGLGTRAARSWMWGQESCRCSVQSFLSALTSQAFLDNVHSPSPRASDRRRPLLVLGFVLPAILTPCTSIFARPLTTLDVEAYGAPPGFLNADLPRYLAQQMAEAGSPTGVSSRFQDTAAPPNRVEWSFKWDPYAGGEVRRFAHPSMSESLFGGT